MIAVLQINDRNVGLHVSSEQLKHQDILLYSFKLKDFVAFDSRLNTAEHSHDGYYLVSTAGDRAERFEWGAILRGQGECPYPGLLKIEPLGNAISSARSLEQPNQLQNILLFC